MPSTKPQVCTLGSLMPSDIEYITFSTNDNRSITKTYSHFASPGKLKKFWSENAGQLLEWRPLGEEAFRKGQWIGGNNAEFHCLIVWVKPQAIDDEQ